MEQKKATQVMNSDFDIMIVGGGPAGISTWLHLEKHHPELAAKCVLIEKEQYPREKICGGALGGWTEQVLSRLQCTVDVPSVLVHTAACRLGDDVYLHKQRNFFRIVRRIEFDSALAQIAVDRGLCLQEHEVFTGFIRKTDSVVVQTNKGKYRVRVLIGADGAVSRVRHTMNPVVRPRLIPAVEVFSPVHPMYDPEFSQNIVSIDFSPVKEGLQGYVWHFPFVFKNRPFMNHGIGDFRLYREKPRADLKKIFLQELQNRHIQISPPRWFSHPISIYEEGGVLSEPNILLVGDAVGIDSAIGGGIHLALSFGDIAAASLVDAFDKSDFSFRDYTSRFQNHLVGRYIRKLNVLAKEMYGDTSKILPYVREIFSKK